MDTEHPREILRTLEQRARRRFGQHFLARPDVVARIVRAAKLEPADRVVEIGPGLGILTRALLDAGADLTAVEIDRDLAAFLRETFPGLRLVEQDALRVDWASLCPGPGWKVVANLPYNVGTQLVIDLLARPETFASIVVMLQREVVDRLVALPGSKAYGSLSVYAAVRAKLQFVTLVPPSAFHPPPKVESAVLRLDPYPRPDTGTVTPEQLDRVVRAAFSQRRKTIVNSLTALFGRERAREAVLAAGIDPMDRAEVVDPPRFVRLAEALAASTTGEISS